MQNGVFEVPNNIFKGLETVLRNNPTISKLGRIFKGDLNIISDIIDNPNNYEVMKYQPHDARVWLKPNNIICEVFVGVNKTLKDTKVPSYMVISKKQ